MQFLTTFLIAVLAAKDETPQVFPEQEIPEGDDFRSWVWTAYALVLVLLALFSLFVVFQTRRVEEKLAHLSERFDKAHPETTTD